VGREGEKREIESSARPSTGSTEKAAGVGWMDFQPRIDNNCLNQALVEAVPTSLPPARPPALASTHPPTHPPSVRPRLPPPLPRRALAGGCERQEAGAGGGEGGLKTKRKTKEHPVRRIAPSMAYLHPLARPPLFREDSLNTASRAASRSPHSPSSPPCPYSSSLRISFCRFSLSLSRSLSLCLSSSSSSRGSIITDTSTRHVPPFHPRYFRETAPEISCTRRAFVRAGARVRVRVDGWKRSTLRNGSPLQPMRDFSRFVSRTPKAIAANRHGGCRGLENVGLQRARPNARGGFRVDRTEPIRPENVLRPEENLSAWIIIKAAGDFEI